MAVNLSTAWERANGAAPMEAAAFAHVSVALDTAEATTWSATAKELEQLRVAAQMALDELDEQYVPGREDTQEAAQTALRAALRSCK